MGLPREMEVASLPSLVPKGPAWPPSQGCLCPPLPCPAPGLVPVLGVGAGLTPGLTPAHCICSTDPGDRPRSHQAEHKGQPQAGPGEEEELGRAASSNRAMVGGRGEPL